MEVWGEYLIERGGLIEKRTLISKTKQVVSLPLNICLGREQGSVMLEIKFQFPMHNITSYH